MALFITGTDTDVGKTIISAWICLHTRADYFKPIQTGMSHDCDRDVVRDISNVCIHREIYTYADPVSPHLAAQRENRPIDIDTIKRPSHNNIVIEGAGGVYVPLNDTHTMMDVMMRMGVPVVLVARGGLGTINHTLLSLHALRAQSVNVLGVIINGNDTLSNAQAIEHYGSTQVLAHIPTLEFKNTADMRDQLQSIPCPHVIQREVD